MTICMGNGGSLAVAGDAFDDVLFYVVLFPHEMSWIRSGTELSHFLRIFLPTLTYFLKTFCNLKSQDFHSHCPPHCSQTQVMMRVVLFKSDSVEVHRNRNHLSESWTLGCTPS